MLGKIGKQNFEQVGQVESSVEDSDQQITESSNAPFVNIAATYVEEIRDSINSRAKSLERPQEKMRWPKIHQDIIAVCADFINEDMAEKYGFPKIIIDQEKIEKWFSLKQLSKDGDFSTHGQFRPGGMIDIDEALIKEQEPYSRTEALKIIGVILHEMLHFSATQILDNNGLRRFGTGFLKKNGGEQKGEFLFEELHEGVVEKVVAEEKKPKIIMERLLERYPEYQNTIQGKQGKYDRTYHNNIFIIDRLCNAIATHDRGVPAKKLEHGDVPYESRYEDSRQVFDVLKKATFGSGTGGLSFGRMMIRTYGEGALEKFGDLLKRTHQEKDDYIRRDGEYEKPFRDAINFLLSDKDGLVRQADEKNRLQLDSLNKQIVNMILDSSDDVDIGELLSEIKQLEFVSFDNALAQDTMKRFWHHFHKYPEKGGRFEFFIDSIKEDDGEVFTRFANKNARDLKKFLDLDECFTTYGAKTKELPLYARLHIIFGENGAIDPKMFHYIGGRKTGRAYFKEMIDKYLNEFQLAQLSEERLKLEEQIERMGDEYEKSKASGIVRCYNYDKNPNIRILVDTSYSIPDDNQQHRHNVALVFQKRKPKN